MGGLRGGDFAPIIASGRSALDLDEISRFLVDVYGLRPEGLRPIYGPEAEVCLVRVDGSGDRRWLLRLRRAVRALPPWMAPGDSADWFRRHARVLAWCRAQGLNVPQVRRTRDPNEQKTHAVAGRDGWSSLLVSYLPGGRLPPGGAALELLGAYLGRLHARGAQALREEQSRQEGQARKEGHAPALPDSWWHPPELAAGRARRLLDRVEEVPDEWLALWEACRQALDAWEQRPALPLGLIHGDCWVGNAVWLPSEEVALIDWEFAGVGAPILDLGCLLEDCYTVGPGGSRVDQPRLEAALRGYLSERVLEREELAALGEAIRFGVAYRGAVRFYLGQEADWDEDTQRGLGHEAERIAQSEAVQRAAEDYVGGKGKKGSAGRG